MIKFFLQHRDNIVVQFSVASFVIMALLAATIAIVYTNRLADSIDLLVIHGTLMHTGQIIPPSDPYSIPSLMHDVERLRWLMFTTIVGGFGVLYVALVAIVWRAWKTIKLQRSTLYERVRQLEDAAAEITQLQGMLPICSHCKNVRDDSGYWRNIETYLGKQMEAEFSHSICPACLEIHYPKLAGRVASQITADEATPASAREPAS